MIVQFPPFLKKEKSLFSRGKLIFWLLASVLPLLSSCADSPPLNPTGYLSPPLGLTAEADSTGDGIRLSFYSGNDENDFDGFNVYVATAENLAYTREGSIPLLPDSVEPTIIMSPQEISSNVKLSYLVRFSASNRTPLSSQVRYYFLVRAHSSQGRVSPPSNEASAIAP